MHFEQISEFAFIIFMTFAILVFVFTAAQLIDTIIWKREPSSLLIALALTVAVFSFGPTRDGSTGEVVALYVISFYLNGFVFLFGMFRIVAWEPQGRFRYERRGLKNA